MMVSRIALVAPAVLMAVPATTPAQERPTVDDVLQRFAAGEEDFEAVNKASNDAGSLLRQVHGPMTAKEIEALIEGLIQLALAPDAHTACAYSTCASARYAGFALTSAVWRPGVYVYDPEDSGKQIPLTADDLRGQPLPEAFDALVRIYETLAARSLAEGGDDPFLEAARRDAAHDTPDGHALRSSTHGCSASFSTLSTRTWPPTGGVGRTCWRCSSGASGRAEGTRVRRTAPRAVSARPGALRVASCTRRPWGSRDPGPDPTGNSGNTVAAAADPGTSCTAEKHNPPPSKRRQRP